MAGPDTAVVVDPGDGLQFGVLADQPFRAGHEVRAFEILVGEVARDAHDLLLALQQAQAHALLRVLDVAAQRLLFALAFFGAQIPEGRHDRGEEHEHGSQRRQSRQAVLPGRRKAAPPGAPPAGRRGDHGRLPPGRRARGRAVHAGECRGAPGTAGWGECAGAAFFHIVVLERAIRNVAKVCETSPDLPPTPATYQGDRHDCSDRPSGRKNRDVRPRYRPTGDPRVDGRTVCRDRPRRR